MVLDRFAHVAFAMIDSFTPVPSPIGRGEIRDASRGELTT
jgi:hypothetical protein